MGVGIPKLYVKFWWPLFLAIKFTFLFLNLAKIQIFIPKSAYGGGGGSTGLGIIPRKKHFFTAFLTAYSLRPLASNDIPKKHGVT